VSYQSCFRSENVSCLLLRMTVAVTRFIWGVLSRTSPALPYSQALGVLLEYGMPSGTDEPS
jgi:hypothetical protein